MTTEASTPAGWYADSTAQGIMRFWDGAAWTENVAAAQPAAPVSTGAIKVVRYKGDKDLQKGLSKMLGAGWHVREQSSRKALYSAKAGVFTHKQIHTVTYER